MNRHITLLLENGTVDDLNKIKEWCKENNIEFTYRYSRNKGKQFEDNSDIAPLYYFTVLLIQNTIMT